MGSRRRLVVANGNSALNSIDTKQMERRKIKKEFRYNNKQKRGIVTNNVRNIVIITLLALLILMCSLVYFSSARPKRISKISEILRKNVEVTKKIIAQVEEFKQQLQEDPIVELIKTKMRPIQERIASLKTQTLQYENLPHIPGGPTQFMYSALTELDKIGMEQLEHVGFEVLRSIGQQYINIVDLAEISADILKDIESLTMALQNEVTLSSLISNGIFLVPQDGKFDKKLNYNSSILIETHLELAELYEKLENITEKMEKEHGFSLTRLENIGEEVENKELLKLLTEYVGQKELIRNVALTNFEKYPLLGVLKQNSVTKFQELFEQLMLYETEKRRPWLDLQTMTRTEIENLKKRVHNLKFSHSKKKI